MKNLYAPSGKTMAAVLFALVAIAAAGAHQAKFKGPLKIYILAGQSNMQGHANISTIPSMANDPKTADLLKEMTGPDGQYATLNNVWISSLGCGGNEYSDMIEKKGRLTVGYGASNSEIGPEYTFGITMERKLKQPILIIKTSWGGRSLMTDFRPPSAGPRNYEFLRKKWKERGQDPDQEAAKNAADCGVFYRHMIDHIKLVLGDIKRVDPDYNPKQGYQLAGFVWFQGFNDMIDDWSYPNRMQPGGYSDYSQLMSQFIRDVRTDLSSPKLPFVIGVMGIGGMTEGAKPPQSNFRQAEEAPASLPEFKGTVAAVQTAPFWDDDLFSLQQRMERLKAKLESEAKKNPTVTNEEKEQAFQAAQARMFTPAELERLKGVSNGDYHYLGAAKILAPVGRAFAEAMFRLQPRRMSVRH